MMAIAPQQTAQLAVFKTKPFNDDKDFVLGWKQFFQSLVTAQATSPKAYSLTQAQRLALFASNVTLGSTVYETDTDKVYGWNGKAWKQLA